MKEDDLVDFETALEKLKDLALERQKTLHSLPTIASSDPLQNKSLQSSIPSSIPDQGWGLSKSIDFLLNEVASALNPGQIGPRYFGFVTGGTQPSALLSDWFTSLYDQNVQVHLPKETFSTVIENYTIRMIIELLELDVKRFSGTFTTGATSCNLLSLICAREETVKRCMHRKTGNTNWSAAEYGLGDTSMTVKVFVCQAHASIRKTAALAGIGRANVIDLGKIANDVSGFNHTNSQLMECLDFDMERLESELKKCYEEMSPAIIVLGMGEVVTGSLTDQSLEIRKLCDKYEAWLHTDAAFSGFVCLIDGYKWISSHLDLCDSITLDGHKALNVPYDCGIVLVKKDVYQADTHSCTLDIVCGPGSAGGPSYLSSGISNQDESDSYIAGIGQIPSPLNRNIENSRRFRALPLYISLLSQGKEGTALMTQRNIDFASKLRFWLHSCPYYEVLTPPCDPLDDNFSHRPQKLKGHWYTTVIFFRGHPIDCPIEAFRDLKSGHMALIQAIKETRKIYVSPGGLCGVMGIRIAVSNWATGINGDDDFNIATSILMKVMERH